MRVFVDTNVFLDVILKREGFEESLIVLNAIEKGIFDGVVLDITILNIDYIAKKQVASIREFLGFVNSVFEVCGASNEMIKAALEMDGKDLEDNLQYICAQKSKCELLISNDKEFVISSIQTFSSAEFVKKYL